MAAPLLPLQTGGGRRMREKKKNVPSIWGKIISYFRKKGNRKSVSHSRRATGTQGKRHPGKPLTDKLFEE